MWRHWWVLFCSKMNQEGEKCFWGMMPVGEMIKMAREGMGLPAAAPPARPAPTPRDRSRGARTHQTARRPIQRTRGSRGRQQQRAKYDYVSAMLIQSAWKLYPPFFFIWLNFDLVEWRGLRKAIPRASARRMGESRGAFNDCDSSVVVLVTICDEKMYHHDDDFIIISFCSCF